MFDSRFFLKSIPSRLSDSPLRSALLSEDFRKLHTGELTGGNSEDDLIGRSVSVGVYRHMPFQIASELITGINLAFTGRNEIGAIVMGNIDRLLGHTDQHLGRWDRYRDRAASGWGTPFAIAGEWVHDMGSSCSIAFAIARFAAARSESCLRQCEAVAGDFVNDIEWQEDRAWIRQPWSDHPEPSNLVAIYICLLCSLFHATQKTEYLDTAAALARTVRASFRYEEHDTVCWPYRFDMEPNPSQFGERYWKSPWVIYAMLICEQMGIVFDRTDIEQVAHTVRTNLIRGGQVYDSLSKTAGLLLDDDRIAYHESKGQSSSLKRLFNFIPLAQIDAGILSDIWNAAEANEFLTEPLGAWDGISNYWTMEALSFAIAGSNSIINFPR